MDNIPKKTLEDLEFPKVLQQVSERCQTNLGRDYALTLLPVSAEEEMMIVLGQTSEYLASLTTDNMIPNHGFESINGELKLLKVENTTLEISGFQRIGHICETVGNHKRFFKKLREYFPLLFSLTEHLSLNTEIPGHINKVFDRFGEVRDNASPELNRIRQELLKLKARINQSFAAALSKYLASEYLDEIRESVVDNRRVLAVKAMYRKKVRGNVLGTSRTGSIVYIEPEASHLYSRELNNLEFDELEEIQRILNQLTAAIRPFTPLLKDYQDYLMHIDVTAAKAKYARQTNALLPNVNHERRLELRDAYHPLLFLANKQSKEKTWPQTVTLHNENRIIVISGPNAGGKSITLKTIGLLQLMLQSGLLVPVHERSTFCLFDQILSDIGDNQSIR